MKYLLILCGIISTSSIFSSPFNHGVIDTNIHGNSWKVTGSAISSLTSSDGRCSFIHVGPTTALTAAHCLKKDKKTVSTLNFSGSLDVSSNTSLSEAFVATCTKHPNYSSKDVITSYDYAICKLSKDIGNKGLKFETLKTDLHGISVNSILYIGGYGCQKTAEDHFYDEYRTGKVQVVSLPNGQVSHIGTTNNLGNGIKGALLCPGDSGGPTFYNPKGGSNRKVIGINSTVIPECIYGSHAINPETGNTGCSCSKEKPEEFCKYRWKPIDNSYISSLSTNVFKNFLSKWIKDNTDNKKIPQICGYNLWDSKICRSVSSGGGLEG